VAYSDFHCESPRRTSSSRCHDQPALRESSCARTAYFIACKPEPATRPHHRDALGDQRLCIFIDLRATAHFRIERHEENGLSADSLCANRGEGIPVAFAAVKRRSPSGHPVAASMLRLRLNLYCDRGEPCEFVELIESISPRCLKLSFEVSRQRPPSSRIRARQARTDIDGG